MSWLVDKSALLRLRDSPDAALWLERVERALVHIATPTRLEVGFSARSAEELRILLGGPPVSLMPVAYLTPTIEDRAVQVQQLLADQGRHRAASIPDLLDRRSHPSDGGATHPGVSAPPHERHHVAAEVDLVAAYVAISPAGASQSKRARIVRLSGVNGSGRIL